MTKMNFLPKFCPTPSKQLHAHIIQMAHMSYGTATCHLEAVPCVHLYSFRDCELFPQCKFNEINACSSLQHQKVMYLVVQPHGNQNVPIYKANALACLLEHEV